MADVQETLELTPQQCRDFLLWVFFREHRRVPNEKEIEGIQATIPKILKKGAAELFRTISKDPDVLSKILVSVFENPTPEQQKILKEALDKLLG